MAFMEVRDAERLRLITGPPGGESYSTDADIPRSVGDVQRTGDAFADWDDDWIYPTLINGWANYGGGHEVARFRKLPGGLVVVEGLVTGGTANTTPFYLPSTHRPALRVIFSGYCAVGNSRMQVNYDNGAIYYPFTNSTSWHSVHFSFWTE